MLTCACSPHFESIIALIFLAFNNAGMTLSPMEMSVTAVLVSCLLAPTTTNSVLLSFRFRKFKAIHNLTLALYLSIAAKADWEDSGLKVSSSWLVKLKVVPLHDIPQQ